MERKVKGYKVFNPDWTCRGKQYSCPGNFEEDVTLSVCNSGMHFCKKASDCFNYYQFDPNNHVAEVVARGNVVEDGDKCATDKLEIIREIPWAELLEIVNTGKWCTGYGNSGDCNSGYWNSGNRNNGNRNSGDWNKTDFSNGCFNTVEPKIYLFNKPSSWTYRNWLGSKARYLMKQIQGDILEWVRLRNMTGEEKTAHPEAETTGGYLKKLNNSESAPIWWRGLTDDEKNIILSIPNFDKEIFKEITGIDVDKED